MNTSKKNLWDQKNDHDNRKVFVEASIFFYDAIIPFPKGREIIHTQTYPVMLTRHLSEKKKHKQLIKIHDYVGRKKFVSIIV